MVAIVEPCDLERKAIRFIQRLRRKYGIGPLLLRTPLRPYMLILSADDVTRVLDGAPAPFSPASGEKRAALAHFEPNVSLTTRGPQRQTRRRFHDDVLESDRPVHRLADSFMSIIREEASELLASLQNGRELTWPLFAEAWFSTAREIILGKQARGDRDLTEILSRLRAAANWVYFRPVRKALRARYYARLMSHLARAEPGSLAAIIAKHRARGDERIVDQVTQWLFAFDGGAVSTFRALALLASHPEQAERCQEDLAAWHAGEVQLPHLRGSFLEAVRLWPTTPAILREAVETAVLGGITVPKGAGILIYAPFFHRDNERLAAADRFEPAAWLGKDPAGVAPLVPFSTGPGACPGRHLVALIGSGWLASLLRTLVLR